MTSVTNRFVLRFNSNIGRVVQLTIPNADTDMTADEARDSMEAIIATGAIVLANKGRPSSVKDATLVTTERTVVA